MTSTRCIHELFEEQAARHPDATALICGADRLSYADLDARADRLAGRLAASGVERGAVVGVHTERGVPMVIAILATLKAGAGYLMLDPDLPRPWLRGMVQDAGVSVVLARTGEEVRRLGGPARPVPLEGEAGPEPGLPHGAGRARPDDLACVMFTSGSTGRPKAVAAPHRAVVETLAGQDYLPFRPDTVWLQCAPVSWDAFALELWGALLFGGTCVLHPGPRPDPVVIARLVAAHGVTAMYLSSSLFNVVVDEYPAALAGVRDLVVGGEALSPAHAGRALDRSSGLRLANGYGPVEAMIFVTTYRVTPADADRPTVPIGRPLPGKAVRLLDRLLRPVLDGEIGEVYAAGAGLALGYLGGPGATAERFVADLYGEPGARMYRTGDLARLGPDGDLEFVGRADVQVKVGGYRVEPAQIEAVLARHPRVRRAAVVAEADREGERHLVAYLVPDGAAARAPAADELRAHLAAALPAFMVPAAFVPLGALPLTATGKLDRAALPRRAPLTAAQRRLWLLDQLGAGSAYTQPVLVRLAGPADAAALSAALSDVVERHEPLRTVFAAQAGEPYALVLPADQIGPELTTIRIAAADLDTRVAELARHRFDLDREPPLRAALLVDDATGDPLALLLVMHHIAVDGWSLGPLLRDLSRAYAARAGGKPPDLPPLPIRYADLADHQRALLGDRSDPASVLSRQLAYWKAVLSGLPDGSQLPRRPPTGAGPAAATVVRHVDAAGHGRLLRLARRYRGSLFMVLHAALAVVLNRAGAGTDLAIGTPVAGRSGQVTDELVGYFVNLLVLRCDLSGDPALGDVLARVREVDLDALAHRDVPFEQVVDELGPVRAPGRHPLVDVVLALQNNAPAELALPGAATTVEVLRPEAARFELLVDIADRYRPGGAPAGLTVTVEYRAEAFTGAFVDWLADALLHVLDAMAAAPDTPIGAIQGLPRPPTDPDAVTTADHSPAPPPHDRVAPRTALERRLAAIWADALAVDRVGVRDNFFALGGNSLRAVRVAARITTAEGRPITAAQIVAAPTVAELAVLVAAGTADPPPRIPRLPRVPRRPATEPDAEADRWT
jgi:amino acid adenylation domain-containing protein